MTTKSVFNEIYLQNLSPAENATFAIESLDQEFQNLPKSTMIEWS